MSRLGKLPIKLEKNIQAKLEDNFIVVKGPLGELKEKIRPEIKLDINEERILVSVLDPENRKEKAYWGLFWSLIKNMVIGVSQGYEKKLEINGVGFKAKTEGNKLVLNLGFSHPIKYDLPEGIKALVEEKIITISGFDKQLVGEVAAQIRKTRKPEPYKGKGVKYLDEILRRKESKAAGKSE